jgi:CcmD family protein
MRIIRNFALLLMVLCSGGLFAQDAIATNVEMADGLRSSGKIYVVVAVVLIILFGLLAYLVRIDRKVSKIEKEINGGKK